MRWDIVALPLWFDVWVDIGPIKIRKVTLVTMADLLRLAEYAVDGEDTFGEEEDNADFLDEIEEALSGSEYEDTNAFQDAGVLDLLSLSNNQAEMSVDEDLDGDPLDEYPNEENVEFQGVDLTLQAPSPPTTKNAIVNISLSRR